ncbi:MAG: Gfo/Idh/MocA family oxidoreductase [Planctomycetia bacterium]|nr:Gfo/Idh/MocA family oxidoreductase [Planctomycetia bacterium]
MSLPLDRAHAASVSASVPQVSRRRFLKTSLAASAALAAPYFVPRSAFGANDRIVTGHIGVKNQGMSNLRSFSKLDGSLCTVGPVCDVDSKVLADAQAAMQKVLMRDVEGVADYRKLLDRQDIDAIVISTPDHWHARMTIDACLAGKDVYCEKPLTHTIFEGRKMIDAVRAGKRIVQTGSQQRSDEKFRQACELVRSGRLGKLKEVLVGIPKPNHPGEPIPDSAPPPELDFNAWLGPAPERAYNKNHVHYNFRFFRDYSGGQMTNFGAHHIDIAHWGMGMDESGPLEIEGTGTFHPQHWHEVTETCRVTYKYPNDVTMIVGQQQKDIPGGVTFIGSEGRIFVARGKIVVEPEYLLKEPLKAEDVRLYVSENHHRNFLECVASRKPPVCEIEIGHRAATACHLGNIAIQTGRKIRWDAVKEAVIDDSEAQALTSRKYRAPFTI